MGDGTDDDGTDDDDDDDDDLAQRIPNDTTTIQMKRPLLVKRLIAFCVFQFF